MFTRPRGDAADAYDDAAMLMENHLKMLGTHGQVDSWRLDNAMENDADDAWLGGCNLLLEDLRAAERMKGCPSTPRLPSNTKMMVLLMVMMMTVVEMIMMMMSILLPVGPGNGDDEKMKTSEN